METTRRVTPECSVFEAEATYNSPLPHRLYDLYFIGWLSGQRYLIDSGLKKSEISEVVSIHMVSISGSTETDYIILGL
jgi:hypothetical protein